MKIVQSCWSCNNENVLGFGAGWSAPEYHIMGWALSCLQLRKYYDDVVLYADDLTATLLIDILRLPYTEVVCSLNEIKGYDSRLWALPKIHTYSKQTTPFIHVDGDIFIFRPFTDSLLKSDLIAQNLEFSTFFYEEHIKKIESLIQYVPPEIKAIRSNEKEIRSYNAGILGGNDVNFFGEYTQRVIECIKRNKSCFSNIEMSVFNVFFEQCIFYAFVRKLNKNVGVQIPGIIGDTDYVDLGDFHEVPFNRQYLHLLGKFKRSKLICEQMACRLRLDYPEFYYRIIALFKKNKLPLQKDYYHFLHLPTEDYLLQRYSNLETAAIPSFQHASISECDFAENDFYTSYREEIWLTIQSRYFDLGPIQLQSLKSDIDSFFEKLEGVVMNNLDKWSNESLYQRDIRQSRQRQMIFEGSGEGFEKKIVRSRFLEIAECKYNWYEAYQCCVANDVFLFPINVEVGEKYVGIIPECTKSGYSLISIDNFDYLILELLESPGSLRQLSSDIKMYMEPDVIQHSLQELESLVAKRIKLGFGNKIIEGVDF